MTKPKRDLTKLVPIIGGAFGAMYGLGRGMADFWMNVIDYGALITAKTPFGRYVTFSVTPSKLDFVVPIVLFTTIGTGVGFLGRRLIRNHMVKNGK